MEHLHRYRTHIYVFVTVLAIATLGIATYCYRYNPTDADIQSTSQNVAVASDVSTWKGVNMPVYLVAANDGDVLTQANFDNAAAAGANMVRLLFRADPALSRNSGLFVTGGTVAQDMQSPAMNNLQQVVAMAAKDNLKVVIAIAGVPGVSDNSIWNTPADWTNYATIWSAIATEFKGNPNVLGFDLMNEPNILASLSSTQSAADQASINAGVAPSDGILQKYNNDFITLIQAVRSVDPSRTVIVQFESGGATIFNSEVPFAGFGNIVYSFHMYQPGDVTYNSGSGSIVYSNGTSSTNVPFVKTTTTAATTTGPTITLKGSISMIIRVNGIFTDPGATATDPTDGDISNSIVVTGSVNTAVPGPTIVTYSVKDSAGKTATVQRLVIIDATSTAPYPTIKLNGLGNLTVQTGTAFTDPGATATDPTDGDITNKIVVTNPVNTNVAGTYTMVYTVTDAAGNMVGTTRRVTVEPVNSIDTIGTIFAPVVAFQKRYNVPIYMGEFGIENGAIYDKTSTGASYNGSCWITTVVDQALQNKWGMSQFNFYWPGWWPSTPTDPRRIVLSAAMHGTTIPDYCTYPPVLGADPSVIKTKPVITLNGANPLNVTVGDTFVDPGATATDPLYTNLSQYNINDAMYVTGTVDTSTPGTYTLTYQVSDPVESFAQVKRTVIVSAAKDSTAPVITLLGNNTMTVNVGDTFVDPGATATDSVDGDITSKITSNSTVNTAVAGTYAVTYQVTDAAGNTTSAGRTVIVTTPTTSGGTSDTTSSGGDESDVVITTPSDSNVTESVNQPITAPVSNTLQFVISSTAPSIAAPVSQTTIPVHTTVSPIVAHTSPTIGSKTSTVTPVITPIGATTITPIVPDIYTNDPAIEALRSRLIAIAPSTTVSSITYTLDGTVVHATTTLPDTWNLNTTTIANGVHTLVTTYHYIDGSAQSSVTVFTVKNGQSNSGTISGILISIWNTLIADLKKL